MSATMPLADLMRDYTPGDGWSWDDEMRWIRTNHDAYFTRLETNIGILGIQEPILLGDDGRVWDGHHRITAAYQLGIKEVTVTYAKDQEDQ